jgi:RimJ/RimL family protein N-acetyltransferase
MQPDDMLRAQVVASTVTPVNYAPVMAPAHEAARGSQPVLTDGVVWLTPWRDDDDAAFADFNLDPVHVRWFDQPPPDADKDRRRAHHADVIRRCRDEWRTGASLSFAVRIEEHGTAIGAADLQPRPPIAANISYAVVPQQRGKGIAPRAVRILAEAALNRFGFQRIELYCDVDNGPSRRVAEKAGFVYEGVRRGSGWFENTPEFVGSPRDEAAYSLTTSDLRPRADGQPRLRSRFGIARYLDLDRQLRALGFAR